jgi:ADP-heptose:LPS heptosyltransferase
MRKLILKCFLSAGDIVMLTAAVRDLHRAYPNRFLTDVRTSCPGLWEHNPWLTPVSEADPRAEVIFCKYPLINRCNEAPYHCLHGFIHFLNKRLGLSIEPSVFSGDIHLSEQEKLWYSQVREVTRGDTPFWIVAAGGKYDVTIKWWQTQRFQAVVDHFRGRIQFVQVGEFGHHHPRLKGVIDLRGETSLRELVRLVYHAQGVLCPVTALMHLAAAVEVRGGQPANRPCVVVAGGREPVHWEAYPDHQFIHTTGALPCCRNGGCWKDRVVPLGDGDERDRPEHLCENVAGVLPRCMDLITAAEVIRRIKLYFDGGALRYLTAAQARAARRGVAATARNRYDDQPLTLGSARTACEAFVKSIPTSLSALHGPGRIGVSPVRVSRDGPTCSGAGRFPGPVPVANNIEALHEPLSGARVVHNPRQPRTADRLRLATSLAPARRSFKVPGDGFETAAPFLGRGVIICGGGTRYFPCAWVCVNMLRRLGCTLPIQLWHRGTAEIDDTMKALVAPLGVECVDALVVRKRHPVRRLGGWELKPYAILHSPFQEVLFIDADNVPVRDPEFLFDTPQFKRTGAIFWPDYGRQEKADPIWHSCGVSRPDGPEFESGQIVVDKGRCWAALRLCLWFNEQSDFYYQHLHGDKETFHLAFRKLGQEFSLVPQPIHSLPATMCQHDFEGRRLFQHRNLDKWNLFARNRFIEDFWFEAECRADVLRLQTLWDGGMSRFRRRGVSAKNRPTLRLGTPPSVEAWMITCAARERARNRTLRRLRATDWGDLAVRMQFDSGTLAKAEDRQTHAALRALKGFVRGKSDYLLFLEDDLAFNRHLRHNLLSWQPLRDRQLTLASLYNPYVGELAVDVSNSAVLIDANQVFGSQAFVVSRQAARYMVRHWTEVDGMQDIRMSRLAGRLGQPIFYHAPSLVQHVGKRSSWGGRFHRSFDFDPDWKA